jgi:hypothetical protein
VAFIKSYIGLKWALTGLQYETILEKITASGKEWSSILVLKNPD